MTTPKPSEEPLATPPCPPATAASSGSPSGGRREWHEKDSRRIALLCAPVAVLLAAVVRAVADPELPNLPFLMFIPSVLACALLGGWRAGALTTALSLGIGWLLFVAPRYHILKGGLEELIRAAGFTLTGAAFSVVGELIVRWRAASRREARRFRSTFENAAVGMACVDLEGRWQLVNQRLCDLLGRSRSELQDQVCTEHSHPEDREAIRAFLRQMRTGALDRHSEERRYVRADGTMLWLALHVALERDEHGAPDQFFLVVQDISERRRAEQREQESEQRLRLALEAGQLGTWDWDLRTDVVTWSEGLQQFSGLPAGSQPRTRADFLQLVHPDDRAHVFQAVERALRDDAYYDVEFRIPAQDETRWAMRRGRVLRDEFGRPVRMLGVGADITPRRRLDEALRIGSERLAMALDAAAMVAWEWNLDTGTILRTGNVAQVMGLEAEQLDTQDSLALIHPEDRERVRKAMEYCAARGGEYSAEFRLLSPDGTVRWVSDRGRMLSATAGQPARMLGILVNITDRKRAEEQLRASEERLRLAQEAAGLGIWDWDLTTGDVSWSPEIYGFFGVAPNSFAPSADRLRELVHPEDRDHVVKAVANAIQDGTPLVTEFRALRPDGSVCWLLSSGQVFTNETGEAVRLVGVNLDITERKQAEMALREAEQQRRLITDSLPVLIAYVDAEEKYQFTNLTYERWFGLRAEDLRGTTIGSFGGAEVSRAIRPHVHAALRGEQRTFDLVLPDGLGGPRYLQITFVPHRDEADRPKGFFALMDDISERKRLEQSVRDSEQRYRVLAETLPQFVWTRDASGQVSYVNQHWMTYTGLTLEHAQSGEWLERVHPEDGPQLDEARRLRTAGQAFEIEFRLRRAADGAFRWHLARGCPTPDGPLRWIGVATDIHARKQAEAALSESEARFRGLADAVPAFVWTADEQGRIDYFNDRWYWYTGLTPETSLGSGWVSVLHAEDRDRVLQAWSETVARELPLEVEFRLAGAGGDYRWFMTRALPGRDAEGRAIQWFGTTTDIHESKLNEAALRRANRELEEFAYVSSHDLQEPLRTINAYTELLLRRTLTADAEARIWSEFIRRGVARMEQLIRDLLSYSRVVHTDSSSEGETDLGHALAEATHLLEVRIKETGARIVAGPLPVVRGEQAQMTHVFQNLLSNALRYGKPGVTPEVHISAAPAGDHWVIAVRDNGIGFEQEYADRIFGLFKRLHGDEYPGTGLGLAICKRVIERCGGSIRAEGRPGEGATFVMTLRAAAPRRNEQSAPATE